MIDKSLFTRVDNIMIKLWGKENHNHSAITIRELFNIHNELFEQKEYSTSCGGCRARVYTRVKDWWLSNKQTYLN
jgi:hypothetical protein